MKLLGREFSGLGVCSIPGPSNVIPRMGLPIIPAVGHLASCKLSLGLRVQGSGFRVESILADCLLAGPIVYWRLEP